MEVASELTPLVAAKLIVYSIGALVHLFLMVLVVGQRGLKRLEWLLFSLVAALFMWNSGNLLGLNVGLFYVASPTFLLAFSRLIAGLGAVLTPPLLVHVHAEYGARIRGRSALYGPLIAFFYLPLAGAPWLIARLLARLELGPFVAVRPWGWALVVWLVAAQCVGAVFNLNFSLRRWVQDPRLVRFHACLAGVQVLLAVGLSWDYLARPLPVEGLGGYLSTLLMFLAVVPSGLVVYATFRYNLLNFRVQRNLVFSIVAIFAGLIYLNFMRRLSGFLEMRSILPSAVTEAVMIFLLVVFLEPVKKVINRALHAAFVSEFESVQKLATEIQDYAKQSGDVTALARFVEARAASALGLKQVILRLPAPGQDREEGSGQGKSYSFPVRRGDEVLGSLDVFPSTPELSGDQFGALELLADQLTAAIELCQLISAKVQLERALAEKAKMAFLGEMAARIAHNVKNPLSSMKTLVQLLEEDSTLPERVRRDCQLVLSEVDRLNANISQVLRYAKPARETSRPVDLEVVAGRALALTRAEAERRQVRLEFESTHAPCPVEGGEEAASDIISNLVVNALEVSPPGGTIRVRLAREGDASGRVELRVEDQGPGIAPELREKIFLPFFTTRSGGTGLGLAIVARRAEEIGGSVECLSPPAPSRGAHFRVLFRAATAAAAAPARETHAIHSDRG